MSTYRNLNEFANRAGSRTKTLLRWVQDILDGKKPFAYHDSGYLGNLCRATMAETGKNLTWIFAPLRIVPVCTGGKVVFVDHMTCNGDQAVGVE